MACITVYLQEMKKKREQVRTSRASGASACVPIGIPLGISFNGCDFWPIMAVHNSQKIWRRSWRCRDEWWALAWCRILNVQLRKLAVNSAKGFCGWKPLFGIKKIIMHPEARFAGLHLFRIAAFFDLVAELVKNVR